MKWKNLILAPFVIAGLAMPASAFAARPSAYAPSLTSTLSGTLNTATTPYGTPYDVNGCGYNASYGGVTVVVDQPTSVAFAGTQVDANGCISLSNFAALGAGSYRIDAWQHVGKKDAVVASTSFAIN